MFFLLMIFFKQMTTGEFIIAHIIREDQVTAASTSLTVPQGFHNFLRGRSSNQMQPGC